MKLLVDFFVPGKAQPAGSKTPGRNFKTGAMFVRESNPRAGQWKTDVKKFAKDAYPSGRPIRGAVKVRCIFHILRPKGHYRSGKNSHLLRDSAPKYPVTKPDSTKLFRGTEDSLKHIILADDSQVVKQYVAKRYSDTPGAHIIIWLLEEDQEKCLTEKHDAVERKRKQGTGKQSLSKKPNTKTTNSRQRK